MITLLAAILAGSPAHACGGFFCSSGGGGTVTTTTGTTTLTGGYGIVPVVQDAERILFRMNDDDTITTFVEVNYQQREDVEFAWIIPIPDVISVDEVTTTDAMMFNELELATAPAFTFQWQEQVTNYNYNYNYGYYGYSRGGCSTMGCSSSSDAKVAGTWSDTGWSTATETVEEQASVEVLEDAVVGPFAIEVIQATDAVDFSYWLADNAYDLPDEAIEPLQHYIDQGHSFLGVKLAPDVPEGPIDTLVFTCPAEAPTIPLILTAIASADRLGITAYLLGEDPWVPTNWDLTRDFAPETQPMGGGQTDYLARAEAEISLSNGQAWVLEHAGDTDQLVIEDLLVNATIKQYPKLVRYRGSIRPWEMTLDPEFGPFPGFEDYDRNHLVDLGVVATGPTFRRGGRTEHPREFHGKGAWLILAPIALLGWMRRRSRED